MDVKFTPLFPCRSGTVELYRWSDGVRRAGSVLASNLISEAAWDCTASCLRCFLCERRSFRQALNLRVAVCGSSWNKQKLCSFPSLSMKNLGCVCAFQDILPFTDLSKPLILLILYALCFTEGLHNW